MTDRAQYEEPPALILARERAEQWGVPCFAVNLEQNNEGKWNKTPLQKWSKITASGVFRDPDVDDDKNDWAWRKATAVGVPMGARSGLIAIDLDDYKGKAPQEWLKAHGAPETRVHGTASGGRHLIFELPDGVDLGNQSPADVNGLDIRGSGGYIVWADTLGRYTVIEDLDPAPLPDSIAQELLELSAAAGSMRLDDRELPKWRPQDVDEQATVEKLRLCLARVNDTVFYRRWHGDTRGMRDVSASAFDMAMASMLTGRGFDYHQIVGLLLEAFEHGAAYRDQDERAAMRCAFRAITQHEDARAERVKRMRSTMKRFAQRVRIEA
ncbi:MAG: bifunctional DNA primase/polymerase [Pseudomonadota bacterium]